MIKKLQFILIPIIFASTGICKADETNSSNKNTRIVFLYNDQEYSPNSLEKWDDEQNTPPRPPGVCTSR